MGDYAFYSEINKVYHVLKFKVFDFIYNTSTTPVPVFMMIELERI